MISANPYYVMGAWKIPEKSPIKWFNYYYVVIYQSRNSIKKSASFRTIWNIKLWKGKTPLSSFPFCGFSSMSDSRIGLPTTVHNSKVILGISTAGPLWTGNVYAWGRPSGHCKSRRKANWSVMLGFLSYL